MPATFLSIRVAVVIALSGLAPATSSGPEAGPKTGAEREAASETGAQPQVHLTSTEPAKLTDAELDKLAKSHVGRFAEPLVAVRGDHIRILAELLSVHEMARSLGFAGSQLVAVELLIAAVAAGSYTPQVSVASAPVETDSPSIGLPAAEKRLPSSTVEYGPLGLTPEDLAKRNPRPAMSETSPSK